MGRDRYERRPRGHSFGATYSGITERNRPILEALTRDWIDYHDFREAHPEIGGRTLSACLNSLIRHGYVEQQCREDEDGNFQGFNYRRTERGL